MTPAAVRQFKKPSAQRSRNMSAIRSSGNATTEVRLLKLFRSNSISGWVRSNKKVLGKPDFIFRENKIAIFVDGCFWHNCPQHAKLPLTNRAFWLHKLSSNTKRDFIVTKILRKQGWMVIRIWEHEIDKLTEKFPRKFNKLFNS
jgi:DNA mismatch endonuclease (patch repair protein)